MAVIHIPRRIYTQPQGRVVPSRGDLGGLWLPASCTHEIVSGVAPSVVGTSSTLADGAGVGVNFSALGRRFTDARHRGGYSRYAWLIVARHLGGSLGTTQSIVRADGAWTPLQQANNTLRAIVWAGGTLRTANYEFTAFGWSGGTFVFCGYSVPGGNTEIFFSRLGSEIPASTIGIVQIPTSSAALSTTAKDFLLGASETGGEVAVSWSLQLAASWYGTTLSREEMLELSRNPWQLFRSEPRRIYSFPSGIPTLSAPSFAGRVPSVSLTY